MTKPRNTSYWIAFSIVLALLIIAPLVLPEFWRRFLTEILIWGLLAMSSDILIGYTGMVSFGHSAFFGLGMYGAAAASATSATSATNGSRGTRSSCLSGVSTATKTPPKIRQSSS